MINLEVRAMLLNRRFGKMKSSSKPSFEVGKTDPSAVMNKKTPSILENSTLNLKPTPDAPVQSEPIDLSSFEVTDQNILFL